MLQKQTSDPVDLLVIGGGINGVGVARDAAGRGLKVILCEKGDLAEGTSSRSGKYIHGGLRYLEYYEFRLVREALIEREVLLEAAPHLTWPLRLVLLHSPEQRPRWLLRLGLLLYDNLGGRKRIPRSRAIDLNGKPEGAEVRQAFRKGFAYYDCWVDDSRLVILNAVDAARRGAEILTGTECVAARREDGLWLASLKGRFGERQVLARCIVNTAGPWVEQVLRNVVGVNSTRHVRLVKGSHIITKRWWQGDNGFVLQCPDKRLIFVNPYFDDLALIGTTDIPFDGRAEDAAIEDSEIDYLLGILDRYFETAPSPADVLATYSGVRPLYDDDSSKGASAVTRDYTFDLDGDGERAPILSAFGGKLTTYRKLAEHALEKLAPFFPEMAASWTRRAPLPGGDIPGGDFEGWLAGVVAARSWLPPALASHYARTFGSEIDAFLEGATSLADLGQHFGGLFYQHEAQWLIEKEWARSAEDILYRRSKHGIFLSDSERAHFDAWLRSEVMT